MEIKTESSAVLFVLDAFEIVFESDSVEVLTPDSTPLEDVK